MTTYNITDYTAGDSMDIDVTVTDAAGTIVDLTGATIVWRVARVVRSVSSVVVTKSLGSGITATAPGKVRVRLNANDLTVAGDYFHELKVTLASGDAYTALKGRMVASPSLVSS